MQALDDFKILSDGIPNDRSLDNRQAIRQPLADVVLIGQPKITDTAGCPGMMPRRSHEYDLSRSEAIPLCGQPPVT